MSAFYNEIDPFAAAWLRELIKAGHIAPGVVDERSIEDIKPKDLDGFSQCHFFAGIGVWSYALRNAGWPDDRPVWTGSCPCQPFSAAGTGAGENDKRHLWPVFAKLIDACRPPAILGEQVASNLITGKRVSEHLQRLWERKARLGILADWLEEDLSLSMQGVPEQAGARISADAQRINGDQSLQAGGSSEITRSDKGPSIRVDSGMGASSARHGSLRSNWDRLRSDGKPWLEYSFSGSGASGVRVHEGQHAGGLVRLERGMRELGGEQGDRDGQCHHETPERAIQRASKATDRELEKEDGGAWIDTLQLDLEGMDYSFCCIPFPSAGVGAPHIRDRTYWVAHAADKRLHGRWSSQTGDGRDAAWVEPERLCDAVVLADNDQHGRGALPLAGLHNAQHYVEPCGGDGGLGHAGVPGRQPVSNEPRSDATGVGSPRREPVELGQTGGSAGELGNTVCAGPLSGAHAGIHRREEGSRARHGEPERPSADGWTGPTNGPWRAADWLLCRDGKWRPVEPGTFPLAHGSPARVGRLRGYGNAINAHQAQIFIETVMP